MNNIFVINLEERKDKMENINKFFSKYFNINKIDAIKDNIGWN